MPPTAPISFRITAQDGPARTGIVTTPHGEFETPAFMPVGTKASVKALTPRQIGETRSQIILGNTYHLHIRPGEEVVAALGGLHGFMAWPGPILTDSGGYQVFSLSHRRRLTEEGVEFRSHIDGKKVFIGPEESMAIQNALGADIIMAFDECPPTVDVTREMLRDAADRTTRWARRCVDGHRRPEDQGLFGIVQGGTDPELRARSVAEITELDLPGYAIGGLALGEGHDSLVGTVAETAPLLPEDRPRYLMGVGPPKDVLGAIGHGVDMFDCVMPTRNARNYFLFTRVGPVRIRNSCHRQDPAPVDPECRCYTCRTFSRGYLRHLYLLGEPLASTAGTIHNVAFYQDVVIEAREAIKAGRYKDFARNFVERSGEAGFALR